MPPQEAANDNKVSPFVWVFFGLAVLCDMAKVLSFMLQLVPIVGIEISVILSFYISVVEDLIVFGGLWFTGLYKAPKGQLFNLLMTFGVASVNLVPEVDDFPFTSLTVFFMIMKAYAGTKLGSLVTTGAIAAATGGVGLAAEGAVAAGGAAEAATAARTAQRAARAVAMAKQQTHQQQPPPAANEQEEGEGA